jgi:hypothetical protein
MSPPLIPLPSLLIALALAADARVDIGRFSADNIDGWHAKVFAGETSYEIAVDEGRRALRAVSAGTASGLYREVAVDLNETPVLNWSWKIENILDGNDERTRAGDDYPARVYVVFSGGLRFWRTRAINYVWSSHQPAGSEWPNAFTVNARMIAVDSGGDRRGEWVMHRRDVHADYRRLFRAEPGKVDAVAIMTDTDNTGQSAIAWYGDIWFSSR